MESLKYTQEGKRDLRLDFLRGFCLFAMAINHAGLDSYWQIITGGSVFLINAADGFFFISGMTLGIISVGRPLTQAVERVLKRTWQVYLATLVLSFGFASMVLLTGIELWEEGVVVIRSVYDLREMAIGILTMRYIVHGSDVLIVYVVYLGLSPLVLWGMHKKHTGRVIAAMVGIYVLSLLSLEMTELPFASFRHLAANNLIFFGGLVIGYHRDMISSKWNQWKLSHLLDGLVIVIGIFFLYLYTTNFKAYPNIGDLIYQNEYREWELPPLNLVIVFIYIRIFWLMATYLWKPLNRITGWLMIPFGQASLFTFMLHLALIPIFWNVPEIFDDLNMLTATFWNAMLIAVLFAAIKIRAWVLNVPAKRRGVFGTILQNATLILAMFFMVTFIGLANSAVSSKTTGIEKSDSEGVFAEMCRNMYEEGAELEGAYADLCEDYVKE